MSSAASHLRHVLLAIALLLVATGCARAGGEAFQPTHNAALAVDSDTTLGQTFRPATAAVRGVDLLVATFGRPADPEGELEVALRDAERDEVVGHGTVTGAQLEDNTWVAVRFDDPAPAPDAAALEIRWTGAEPVALRANVPPAQLDEDRLLNDPYPGGELLLDGERAAGDLAFRVIGEGGLGPAVATATGIARGTVRGLADRPVFAIAWALLLAGAVTLAVTNLRAARRA